MPLSGSNLYLHMQLKNMRRSPRWNNFSKLAYLLSIQHQFKSHLLILSFFQAIVGEGSTEIWLKSHGSGEIDNHSTMCICFYLDYSSHNYKQLSSLKIVILDKIVNFKHNSSPFRFHLSPFFNFCNGVIEYETPKARKCLLNISSPYWYYNIHILFCLKKKHSYGNTQTNCGKYFTFHIFTFLFYINIFFF